VFPNKKQEIRERENLLPKTKKPLSKLKNKRGRCIDPHKENFHLILHLNWKKFLHQPKPQPRRGENFISLNLLQQIRQDSGGILLDH
jgi:hypothetical protein